MVIAFSCVYIVGLVTGYLVGRAADASYRTFNYGATWFIGGNVRRPVTNPSLVCALQAVRREVDVSHRGELTIEVRK